MQILPVSTAYIIETIIVFKTFVLQYIGTVGGLIKALFAEKYCSVDSIFFTTQTTYEVAAAFIDLVILVANRHNLRHKSVGFQVLLLAKVYYFKKSFFRHK